MNIKKFLCVVFLLLGSFSVSAANIFVEGGLHVGGDTLVTVTYFDDSTEKVRAGQLFSASVGFFGEAGEGLEWRASLGVKIDGIFAANGDVDFTRFPLELMLFDKGESFDMGLGLTYHLDPTLTVSADPSVIVSGTVGETNYDDAFGFLAELDYKIGSKKNGYVGLKLTVIDYDLSGAGSVSESGNSLGVVLGIRF